MIASAKPRVYNTPKPPDNTDEGKEVALQWFVGKCSIGPLGSIMKRSWSDATSNRRGSPKNRIATVCSRSVGSSEKNGRSKPAP